MAMISSKLKQNFINGSWQDSQATNFIPLINPATLQQQGLVGIADDRDVEAAISAAASAQTAFRQSSKQQRLELFDQIIAAYQENYQVMAESISLEMGAPITLAKTAQAGIGLALLKSYRHSLSDFEFCQQHNSHKVYQQAIGVAVLITPWNWPMNQIVAKVAAALAAGCCMVLKPSEYAPLSAIVFANILQQAGVAKGVFNLLQGDASTGSALVKHPKTRMVSITGSTAAGAAVAKLAAPSIKRVCQELGGKSAYLITSDVNLSAAIDDCCNRITINSGQSCNAPSRLLVPKQNYPDSLKFLQQSMAKKQLGQPSDPATDIGPVVNRKQFQHIHHMIKTATQQGARLICGDTEPTQQGYFIKPTVLADVTPAMDIFHQEVFGPVLSVTPYDSITEAIELINNSDYGLSAYIDCDDPALAERISLELEVGMVHINGAAADPGLPFGGWKMSGNGRERGHKGIEEYLESKAVFIN